MKNKNGFTLIELLAVITIIGIILLIAIPSIYLIVENSRRSAFAKLAHTYINAVKSLVITDDIICTNDFGTTWKNISQLPHNHHCYYNLQTAENSEYRAQTIELIETGGKSPWGQLDILGTIRFYKKSIEVDGVKETRYYYLIRLRDTSWHGTPSTDFIEEEKITKEVIVTKGSRANISSGTGSTPNSRPYLCRLK